MFEFISPGASLADALTAHYDVPLVVLSYLIATLAAYTSLSLSDRVGPGLHIKTRIIWLVAGSTAMGIGVWAMHFVGMLAYELPIPVRYDLKLTGLSVIPAILASLVMIFVICRLKLLRWSAILAGALMGGGIGAMHFTGMAAMRLNAQMVYEPRMFALSIIVAMVLASVALFARRWFNHLGLPDQYRNSAAAPVMGLAIAATHYTAMTATYFFPLAGETEISALAAQPIALAVAAAVAILLGLTLIAVKVSRRLDQAAHEVRASRIKVNAILDSVADGIITIDRTGYIRNINPGGEEMFDYARGACVGKSVEILMTEADAVVHGKHINGYLQFGISRASVMRRQIIGRRRGGDTFPVDISVTEMNVDGESMFVGVCRDVTELDRARRALQRSNEDLENFAYIASHDLKAPLRSIESLANWIAEDLGDRLTPETAENLALMGGRIRRMENMLDALLEYSKVGSSDADAEKIDSGELVQEVIDYLGLPEQFKVEVADNMPVISTQRAPMELVFRNLISNAVKHHDRHSGIIRVSGEHQGNAAAFTVGDDGPGIPEKDQDKIFDMFKTLRPRDEVEGSGMGLSLVRKTIDRNQGSIEVASDGRGTEFRFTWAPLEAVHASAAE